MEAFASMRMNDLHFNDPAIRYPLGQGDFWLEHPHTYIGDATIGWHADGALNFVHPQVRAYKLAMIAEICERFDIDGIDLDFMRFPVYFTRGEGERHIPLMTAFVRKARAIVDRAGQQRGRKLELGVRLPTRMDICRRLGFDPVAFARQRLVDFITLTPFLHNFPSVPVRRFREQLGDDAMPIYAGLMAHSPHGRLSQGAFRASAANCFREDADGLYLFNYFFGNKEDRAVGLSWREPSRGLLQGLGKASALQGCNKVYSAGTRGDHYGSEPSYVLPASVAPGETLTIGVDMAEEVGEKMPRRVLLFLRVSASTDLRVTWNSAVVPALGNPLAASRYDLDQGLEEGASVHGYELPPDSLIYGTNAIKVQPDEHVSARVLQADVVVEHGTIQEHGHF
jgi:hypothetical protein